MFPGNSAWYTIAFYEELCNTASSLVAQDQEQTAASGLSDTVLHRHHIDEVLHGYLVPGVPSSWSHCSGSTETTLTSSGQLSTHCHLTTESSELTSGVVRPEGTCLCLFVGSPGVCHAPNTSRKRGRKGHKTEGSHS